VCHRFRLDARARRRVAHAHSDVGQRRAVMAVGPVWIKGKRSPPVGWLRTPS
jgi:hypothetical protein